MAVINISLPNLGTELALIADEISIIEANVPENLLSLVNPHFIFKGSADCSTFYLDDVTADYPIDTENDEGSTVYSTTLNVTYIYRADCGDIIPYPSEPMSLNGRLEFENIYGDGEYCVSIDVVLTRTQIGEIGTIIDVFTDTFEECLTQNCCLNSLSNLRKEVVDCMSSFPPAINSYKNIGRSAAKLMERYSKMSNLLWVIDHTDSSCSDYENLKCLFKKI
jgi:hypothetical protein